MKFIGIKGLQILEALLEFGPNTAWSVLYYCPDLDGYRDALSRLERFYSRGWVRPRHYHREDDSQYWRLTTEGKAAYQSQREMGEEILGGRADAKLARKRRFWTEEEREWLRRAQHGQRSTPPLHNPSLRVCRA